MNIFYVIVLGLILGTITGVFLILNSKINNLYKLLSKLTDIELTTNKNITETLQLFSNLVDRFNKRILVDNEHFEILNSLINDKFRVLDYNYDCIKERLDIHNTDTQNLIITENRQTRNEIKKKTKISSKINSKTKTNKSINHK